MFLLPPEVAVHHHHKYTQWSDLKKILV